MDGQVKEVSPSISLALKLCGCRGYVPKGAWMMTTRYFQQRCTIDLGCLFEGVNDRMNQVCLFIYDKAYLCNQDYTNYILKYLDVQMKCLDILDCTNKR